MGCIQTCITDDVQFIYTSNAGTFSVTSWADEAAFITFDDDQTVVNLKRDSEGNVYMAGHNYIIRPFTLSLMCSDEARAIDAAWRAAGPMGFCGDGEIISGCCDDYSFESMIMSKVHAPDIGTEIGLFSFSFEGVVL